MADTDSDPEVQDWRKLLNERKALYKMVQKEKARPITSGRVREQLSEREAEFVKRTPDYGAFSESAMKISSLSKVLYIKNRGCVTSFCSKFNSANEKVKKAVEEIIQRG